jgi:hypothetical protein
MTTVAQHLKNFVKVVRRDYLSWYFRPSFLRKNGKKSSVLFAGPWIGEFGWELMNWQGFVRKTAAGYDKVIVSCRKGNEGLYKDFCSEFVFHTIAGDFECNIAHNIRNPKEMERVLSLIPEGADVLRPMGFLPLKRQHFITFGRATSELAYDIIFHPRGRTFGTVRNWDLAKWNELITLCVNAGYRVACIGIKEATLDLDLTIGYDDKRDIPLEETFDLFTSSRLVIGPSSGPMHLASLCGTPHLVWTDKKKHARGRVNRDKYEWWWNPHNAKAIVLDSEGFDPAVSTVYKEINSFLK